MREQTQKERLTEIERWIVESRRELDEAFRAAGVDPEALEDIGREPVTLSPEMQRAYEEIAEAVGL